MMLHVGASLYFLLYALIQAVAQSLTLNLMDSLSQREKKVSVSRTHQGDLKIALPGGGGV